jgi:cytochrome P450
MSANPPAGPETLSAGASQRIPPGPRGLPVIGHLLPFLRSPMEAMKHVAWKYGGIARIPIRGKFLYLVSDPDLLHELLVTHRQSYTKNTRYHHMKVLVGQGLLLSEGDEWKRQRLIAQPAFKPSHLDGHVGWMAQMTTRFLDGWQQHCDSSTAFDCEPDFNRLAQRLAMRALLGPHFEEIAEPFCKASVDAKNSWPKAPRNLFQAFRAPSKQLLDEFNDAISRLDNCIYSFLEAHRESHFENCGVLSLIVQANRAQGRAFSAQEMRDQIFTLYFAGHETSATAMCWIHYLLFKHPDVRERMFAEVRDVLQGRTPTSEDVEKLVYVDQVVQESLRLYSPIHSISRVAAAESQLGGYRIPAGATVYISMYATHRLPEFWPDPERFDPERFTPEQSARRPRFAYIPFAAGHRNCIGAAQAMIELKLVVAQIAQRYRVEIAPGQRIEPAPGTTMYPRYGLKVILRPMPALQ